MYAMDLNALSDLVMNGLARLDLALELNFLCIELCQKLYRSMFLMQAFHVTQLFVLFWSCDFPCIIYMKTLWLTLICGGFLILLKNSDFFLFSKTSMQAHNRYSHDMQVCTCILGPGYFDLALLPNGNREGDREGGRFPGDSLDQLYPRRGFATQGISDPGCQTS